MPHHADDQRYQKLPYKRCGQSGLKLPLVSLGLWHNFAGVDPHETARQMLCRAFDLGVTHFDLANNYGPPPGSAEETLGRALRTEFRSYRDELVISTKAGWGMWPGPYGDFGSRKYLIASLDQSLKRLGLDYVDIFYHHRPDPETPLEETMRALEHIVRSGRALYVGISSYDAQGTRDAAELLRGLGTPCIIHQPSYSMFNRWVEKGLLQETQRQQMGVIAFSPLAQGLLTDRYLKMVPQDSRIAKQTGFLSQADLTPQRETALRGLFELAQERGQTLAQLALSWVLRDGAVTSALIGASKISQVEDCIGAMNNLQFTPEERARIDALAPSTS